MNMLHNTLRLENHFRNGHISRNSSRTIFNLFMHSDSCIAFFNNSELLVHSWIIQRLVKTQIARFCFFFFWLYKPGINRKTVILTSSQGTFRLLVQMPQCKYFCPKLYIEHTFFVNSLQLVPGCSLISKITSFPQLLLPSCTHQIYPWYSWY